jgi:hypothetical protein
MKYKYTKWGLWAMLFSFLLSFIIAMGSLIAVEGELEAETIASQPISIPVLLVTFLDPLAILLEILAIVFIFIERRHFGALHQRLALIAMIFFIAWAIANFAVFIPLSFLGMKQGSLSMVKTGQMVKAGAALLQYSIPLLLQYSIPFLLIFGLSSKLSKKLLYLALAFTVVGNFVMVVLPIRGIQLVPVETGLYTLQFSVNYFTGICPLLLFMGYLGCIIYMISYAILIKETKAHC